MSYMDEFEQKLRGMLQPDEHDAQPLEGDDVERIVAFVKKEVLQSYKNGIRRGEGRGRGTSTPRAARKR